MCGSMGVQGSARLMCCTFSSENLASSRFFQSSLVRQHPAKTSFQVGKQTCCQKYFQLECSAATCWCRSRSELSTAPGYRPRRPRSRWAPGAGPPLRP
ncbi:hypothetical protein N305_06971, partial [Manacus vitellinus]